MKRYSFIIFLLLSVIRVQAQNIVAAEYFFDADPGVGMGTAISIGLPASTVNFTASIPTASLSSGFHTLAVRTKDENNLWSLFETRAIYISSFTSDAAPITHAEYFIDADPGIGLATPINIGASGNVVSFTTIIPAASLTQGFHILAIRTRNADGQWSLFETRAFYINNSATDAAAITAAEYFIDSDPGTGNGTAINIGSSGNTVTFTALVPTTSLAGGFHTLAIRTRNTDGEWSLFETRPFYISSQTTDMGIITAAEYFIDTDPGVGNGSSLAINSPGNTVNQMFIANVPAGTSNGQHRLAIRTRDANGIWSLFEVSEFTVSGFLPLEWISFTGRKVNGKVALKWITDNEINTSHFDVERSTNGIAFSKIGEVAAANRSGMHHYNFDDLQPHKGLNYYRLKQIDRDGRSKYSIIVQVLFYGYGDMLIVYPNPAKHVLNIRLDGYAGNPMINIYNEGGQLVKQERLKADVSNTIITSKLAAGRYTIQISDGRKVGSAHFIKE